EVVELALETMAQIVDYDTITMWRRIDAKMMQLVGVRGVNIEMSPPIRADVTEVIRLKQIVDTRHVMTIDNLPHFLESYPYVLPGDKDSKSWLGVPLISEENVTGLMIVTKAEPGFYSPQSEQAALAFANQVAVAISNAELFTETTARTERLSILNRVSLALVQSMDSENIFEIALTEIATALSAEKSRAILFDRAMTSGRVIVDYPRGEKTPTRQINLTTSAMYRYIIERRHPLIFSYDRARMQDMLDDQIRHEIEANGLREYLLLPMMATGRIIGAFEFETRSADLALGAETMEIGLIIANQTAIAIQNANQLEEIRIRERELTTLLEAARSTSLMMDLQQVFEKVADLVINTLDVDDCAIMIWDDLENVLEVQLDVNSAGDPDRISPQGTRFDLLEYPARLQALRSREVIVVDVDDPTADEKERMELTEQQDQVRMLVPLVVRDQSIGLIQIEIGDTDRAITEQERGLARAMGSQVAIAIENARLSTETAAQMDELFIINDLSQAISSTIDVDAMLNIVRQQVPGVTGANEMYVALYDEETDEITFPMAMRDDELYQIPPRKIGTDEVSFIINNRRPLNLDNNYFSAEDLRKSLGLTNGEGDVKSYLGVPLVAGDRVLGVLAVRDRDRTRVFGLNDQRILTTVGSQLGATLQNANLFQQIQEYSEQLNAEVEARTEELEEERDRLDMLYQITAELALTLDMDRVLSRALQMIASAVKAHDGVIMLIDPMTDRLYNRASLSHPTEIEGDSHKTHPAESLASWLIHNEHELLVDDLHEEEFWIRDVEGAELWRSAMAVLLETNEDVQGVLVLLSRDVAAFGEPLLNLVIAASNQVASAINNADLYQLIRDQAERLGTLLRTEQEDAEKSNAILEGIADGVMLTDAEGRISLFNSAAEEMLGLSRNEAMDRTLPELITVHGEEVATWAEPVIRWTSNVDEQDMTLVPADRLNVGDTVVSVNIAPVHIGPQYLGAVSVFRDVTRDVEVDNLKNEFIKSATHELRTPLTPIKGYASMLLMSSTDMPESIREPIRTIKSNADRLAALVEDLLAVSNIDAGESRMNIEPVDLREVVDVQLKNSQNRHFGKELQIQTQYEDD
ncbi:MAG: GAF domain-containing protein, partial [Chloroflexota bacterium]